MKKTFPLRRKEINEKAPVVSDLIKEYQQYDMVGIASYMTSCDIYVPDVDNGRI